ncbi:hypothetical protein J6G99_03350 [bacterium]|nr:hypothetical protein [bacterium]
MEINSIMPKSYAELSSVAKRFLKNRNPIKKPVNFEPYKYLSESSNIEKTINFEPISEKYSYFSPSYIIEGIESSFSASA